MTVLEDVAAARAALTRLDGDIRRVRATRAAAMAARDAAVARGDAPAAAAAAAELDAAQSRLDLLERGRPRTVGEVGRLRSALLATMVDPLALTDARYPLLLLPLRLEARFGWQHPTEPARHVFARPGTGPAVPLLLVRIYPDDIHADSHDPALTPQELRWQREYVIRAKAAHDRIAFVNAWEQLIGRVGPQRAAWIVHASRRPGVPTAANRWGRPPRAALLPDRVVGRAWVDGQVFQAAGSLVREPLDLAPDPARSGPGADGLRWMVDFAAAEAAGLALRIPLPATAGEAPPVDRLVVVGAHASRDPASSAVAFRDLLDAHHYTAGLAFARPGAATNAIPGERPDRSTRPSAAEVFAVEGDQWPLAPATSLVDDRPADGIEPAALLGLDATVFGHVAGADGRWRQVARDIRQLIAAAWLGPLQHLLDPMLARDDLAAAGDFFVHAVDGLGAFPVLRVGDQPYGILPVSVFDPGQGDLDPFQQRLTRALGALRARVWAPAAGQLPRIGGPPADPTATLLALLRTDGVARSLAIRPAGGPDTAAAYLSTVDEHALIRLRAVRRAVARLLGQLAGGPTAPPLADLLLAEPIPVHAPLVQPETPGPGQSATEYLDLLSLRTPLTVTLLDLSYENVTLPGGRPRAFLFALARLALLAAADRACRGWLLDAGMADADTVAAWDLEQDQTAAGPTPLYELPFRLNATLPADPQTTLHSLLTGPAPPVGGEPFVRVREAIRSLAMPPTPRPPGRPGRHPPDLLDTVLRCELGPVTHRLDAWYTALATERLRRLRAWPGLDRGLVVGGYGVLLELTPALPATTVRPSELPADQTGEVFRTASNAGYVHTPSAAHAATAAVLRSAHLAQWRLAGNTTGRDAFSIDLSSRRVRTALQLLDGVREGQPLAALLGYRIERLMRAAPQGVAVLRRAAPLVAGRLTAGGPAEQVAAANVVDALGLLDLVGAGDTAAVSAALQPHAGALTGVDLAEVVAAAVTAVADARDALDAVADLLVAEGVFQLVRGNPTRSAGAVDAIAAAGNPPPDPEVVATTRTGIALTHRVAVALPSTGPNPIDEPGGWAVTPRATLEPALERWARAILPDPADVVLAFTGTTSTITLGALQQAAADAGAGALRLSAIDVVASASPDRRAALTARLVAMARLSEPAVTGLDPARPTEATLTLTELLEAAAALRELLQDSRPLRPDDLIPPGTPPAAVAVPEAAIGRLDAVAGMVQAAHADLAAALATARADLTARPPATPATLAADRAALIAALLAADAVGASQAVPIGPLTEPAGTAADLAALTPTAVATHDELAGRIAAYGGLAAATGANARAGWAVDAARALLGPTGWLLPALAPPGPTDPAPTAGAVPDGATPQAARQLLGRHGSVRRGVARLDHVLGTVEALHGAVPALAVTQRPLSPGERWVAVEPPGGQRIRGGRVSVLFHLPFPTEGGPVAGLLADDWIEVVPDDHATTSIAFHYDAPSSAAPNVMLLAVPRPGVERWSTDAAVAVVVEALDLARLRAVDPDALTGAGQLLPPTLSLEHPTPGVGATLTVDALTDPA